MPYAPSEPPVGETAPKSGPGVPSSTLASNFSALATAHAAGLLIPLFTVPYLARVLRPDGWAPVLIAQSLAATSVLLLEYGFDLSATRGIALARSRGEDVTTFVWAVQGAKLLLLPVAMVVILAASACLPALRGERALGLFALVLVLARGFSPLWYFLGRERIRGAIAVDTAGKVAGALSVLIFVRAPNDGWRVLALQAGFATASCLILSRWLWQEVPPIRLSLERSLVTLRHSSTLFAFRASSALYMQANTVLLGFFAPPSAVAAYGGAEKLVRAALNLLEPVTKTLLPRISFLRGRDPAEAARMIARTLLVLGSLTGAGAALLALIAPLVIRLLLGPGYEAAIPVLRLLALLLPIIASGTVFGTFWALPFARERALLAVTAAAGALNVLLVLLLVPRYGAVGMAGAVVLAELMVSAALGVMYTRWLRASPFERAATA